MTDPLDTLRALEAAATPGPWTVDSADPTDVVIRGPYEERWVANVGNWSRQLPEPPPPDTDRAYQAIEADAADAALIAAARNALPALLTIAEAAQELLAVDWHADAPVPSVATLTFDFRGDRSALARAVEALLAASTAKATL